jgi:hypothetical protein
MVAIPKPYRRHHIRFRKREQVLLFPLMLLFALVNVLVWVPWLLWVNFKDMLLRCTGWCFMSGARAPRANV